MNAPVCQAFGIKHEAKNQFIKTECFSTVSFKNETLQYLFVLYAIFVFRGKTLRNILHFST